MTSSLGGFEGEFNVYLIRKVILDLSRRSCFRTRYFPCITSASLSRGRALTEHVSEEPHHRLIYWAQVSGVCADELNRVAIFRSPRFGGWFAAVGVSGRHAGGGVDGRIQINRGHSLLRTLLAGGGSHPDRHRIDEELTMERLGLPSVHRTLSTFQSSRRGFQP